MTDKRTKVLIIAVVIALAFLTMAGSAPAVAYATDTYSSVLDDLRKDETFDVVNYPASKTDYSVSIIQIAENEHGGLFIYTYQPAERVKLIKASKINMSLSPTADDTKLYDLKLINKSGVFAKYEVVDFVVNDKELTRYYNISAIYRPWIMGIDKAADADRNVVNSVAYKAAQLWTAKSANDTVYYDMKEVEVITITSQMIGMRRYSDGFKFAGTKICDAHYMAFTCDHEIDKLVSADISFVTTPYTKMEGQDMKFGTSSPQKVTLYDFQTASNEGGGWFGDKSEWHRMTSVQDFMNEVEMSDKEKQELARYDWVLNFYETEYTRAAGGKDILISLLVPFGFIGLIVDSCTTSGTVVSDVTLLRLEFEYDGEIYNLGVVADSQSGDPEKATNERDVGEVISDWFKKVGDWFKNSIPNWVKILLIAFASIIGAGIILFLLTPGIKAIKSISSNHKPTKAPKTKAPRKPKK